MGLFDAFTGAPGKKAAAKNEALLNQNQNTGMGYLDTAKTEGLGYLQTGMDTAQGYLGQAGQAFQPLADLGSKYGKFTDMYGNALGINGAAGNAAAQGAFQAGPGYQFALDQGLGGLARQRAVGSMGSSGNADADAIKYAMGLGNQEYNNWRNNFAQFINPELQATQGAAQGQAAALGQQANVAQGGNTNMANLTQNDASNRVNLGNMTTQGLTQNNNMLANSQTQASSNMMGAIGSGLSLLASIPTGGLSLAGLGGGLFSGKTG